MPSHDSVSPSHPKRPGMAQRTSSTHSLSSSAKHQHKPHRPHVVHHRGQHGRNPSFGKNLNKLARLTSTSNLTTEGQRSNHQRKKSGATVDESTSPRPHFKRNSSHVSLPKVASHTSLKKNHSTTSIPRNTSVGQLKKLGLAPPPAPPPERRDNTVGGFSLGDNSSEDGEAEWEDSSHSPNTTRQNSTSEGMRNGDEPRGFGHQIRVSPPAPLSKTQHQSAPALVRKELRTPTTRPVDDTPPLLQHTSRSSRAPPAVSSVAAFARPPSSVNLRATKNATDVPGQVNASSSAENGVSHFVDGSLGANGTPMTPDLGSEEDSDSPSSFLPHYHPQATSSGSHSHGLSSPGLLSRRSNGALLPSRTQQRLDLQRREAMRSATTPTDTDPGDVTLTLRARSASRGRGRTGHDLQKAAQRNYDSACAQLEVVKRYRNPVAEALTRLKEMGILAEKEEKSNLGQKDRPVSRAGSRKSLTINTDGGKTTTSEGNLSAVTTPRHERTPSRGRVRFERQGSHDDIGLSRSHGEDDFDDPELAAEGEETGNAEEALLRRMWESREVYEAVH